MRNTNFQNTLFSYSIGKLTAGIVAGMMTVGAAFGAGHQFGDYRMRLGVSSGQHRSKAATTDYQMIRLEVPGSVGGMAIDINNRGTVGGVFVDGKGGEHTFVWERGEYKVIASPEYPITSVPSITDSGRKMFGNWGTIDRQFAGTYDVRTATFNALPDFQDKPINVGYRMNNAGTAVGQACDGTFVQPINCVAWIWTGTQYETIEIDGVTDLVPQGINDRGQVVGFYLKTPPFDFKSFVYERGKGAILLETDAMAHDINNQGDVSLLIEVDPQLPFVPALLESETKDITALPVNPGSFTTFWVGMNERGDFAGWAPDPTGPERIALVLVRK